jgi:penicillin-binding protein 1A
MLEFISKLFFQGLRIFHKRNSFFFLMTLLFFVGVANSLVLVSKWDDFELVKTADTYQTPSTLYGLNENNEFEPIAEFYQFSKIVISIDNLKPVDGEEYNRVIQAFLSAEDNDFFNHWGLDLRGISRAFVVNIIAGRIKEGASTITQQVARLKFLSVDRSFVRKAREAWLAILMERQFQKSKILEMYLNEIPLGHGTLGVGAAARFFFRKEVNDLSWGEAAMLSSLTTRPKEFSPLVNPNLSSSKVRINFMKLIENGILDIKTAEEEYQKFSQYYETLNRSPNDSAYSDRLNRFPYFTEHARRTLLKKLTPEQLYNNGLKVYSTLVIQHQESAEKVMSEGLKKQTIASNQKSFRDVDVFDDTYGLVYNLISDIHDLSEFKFKILKDERTFRSKFQEEMRDELSILNYLSGSEEVAISLEKNYQKQNTPDHLLPVEGSLISMRPHTGYITSIVGGSGFRSDNQQIRSFQALRQPGSAFKPLVYVSTLDYFGKNPTPGKNITASSQFLDSPLNYVLEDGDEWTPENYSQDYAGFMRLRSALESSKNSVAVRLVEEIGLTNLIPTLTNVLQPSNREIPKNYSVALGTFEVTPYELTRAYALIASGGKEVFPLSILYVNDSDGSTIIDYRKELELKEKKQILSPEASYIITNMMEDVIRKGTGKAVLSQGVNRPVAGKTGTTNNFRDAWFVGFTPELVASVWMGYDVGTLSLGRGMAGGVISTPLWGKFIAESLRKEPVKSFNFGKLNIEKVKVCKLSGKRPGPGCSQFYDEIYIPETLDEELCNDHFGYGSIDDSYKNTPIVPIDNDPIYKTENKKSKKEKSKSNKTKNSNKNLFMGDEKID